MTETLSIDDLVNIAGQMTWTASAKISVGKTYNTYVGQTTKGELSLTMRLWESYAKIDEPSKPYFEGTVYNVQLDVASSSVQSERLIDMQLKQEDYSRLKTAGYLASLIKIIKTQ